MKKLIIVIAALSIAAGAAFFVIRNEKPVQTYRFEKVTRGEIVATVTATGTVNAVTTVQVGSQVSGTIKTLYVDYNSPVSKGQIIARIDPTLFQAAVEQARANLISAQANLEKSEAALVNAKWTYEKYKELLAKNFIAQSDFLTAESTYEADKAQVDAAKAAIKRSISAAHLR